eukprot:326297-Chlamydomonas_euryale.AAC.1
MLASAAATGRPHARATRAPPPRAAPCGCGNLRARRRRRRPRTAVSLVRAPRNHESMRACRPGLPPASRACAHARSPRAELRRRRQPPLPPPRWPRRARTRGPPAARRRRALHVALSSTPPPAAQAARRSWRPERGVGGRKCVSVRLPSALLQQQQHTSAGRLLASPDTCNRGCGLL